jgi:hypothetical protein
MEYNTLAPRKCQLIQAPNLVKISEIYYANVELIHQLFQSLKYSLCKTLAEEISIIHRAFEICPTSALQTLPHFHPNAHFI